MNASARIVARVAQLHRRHAHGVGAPSAAGADGYRFNPAADFTLGAGMTLVVLGPLAEVEVLRAKARKA
jgi:hypothetical protein